MSRIRSNNTSIEVLLRKALWHEGVRYRKNYGKLPGKPDIAITKYKIAIFCDGELWHGKDWENRKASFKTNRDYWVSKIERNIARDIAIDKKLGRMGWNVIRFWGGEINKNLADCVSEVKEAIYEIKHNFYRMEYDRQIYNETDSLVAEDEPEYGSQDLRINDEAE